MLQQGDTAVIYPEAPEDEPRHGTPDASGPDENGTPDAFSQLLTCPYCSRGYKRYTSLKEHIKYRHEKSEDNFSCSQCSYTFAHRAQLEKHMTAHKAGRDQRHISQSGGNRKFKCTECGKAFKYKHHLKEHLRIHSGEKPYECSNCKKRFSHSGSYSSHISSKKCVGPPAVNGRPRPAHARPSSRGPSSPAALPKQEHSKPLQEQLPLHQIKSEPLDYEYKPAHMPTAVGPGPQGGGLFGGAAAVQALVLPTVGLVSPININLADLQSVLKVAVDGNVLRQVLESNARGPLQNQQLISAISLPIVGQDGSAKIIINYSLDPSQTPVQLTAQNLKTEPQARHTGPQGAAEKLPEDLTVRVAARSQGTKEEDGEAAGGENRKTTKACLLCDERPGGLETLHALKHCKKEGLRINGTALEKSESAVAALLADGEPGSEQPKNLLSLLKAYFALNAEPTEEELAKISDSVSLPARVVQKWFDKMQEGQISLGAPTPPSEEEEEEGCESQHNGHPAVSPAPGRQQGRERLCVAQASPTEASPAEANGAHCSPAAPSPLNLTAGAQSADGPLDLSLPKRDEAERALSKARHYPSPSPASANQEEPLNLTCTKRDSSPTLVPLYASLPSANHLGIMTTQQPTLVAIAEQSRGPCLRALHTSQTLLIPQLAYTYTTTASSPAGTETQEKTVHLNRIKEERQDTSSEGISTMDDQNDSDSAPPRKKMRKTESGMYACDLCDKIFQKSSSLLRHKYEHTGKRPHECGICTKAFKHKHHLIEHMRLHSGEKPYQCDKCGKRFSHSGSYSQHMNHRYSYCKREDQAHGGGRESPEGDADAKSETEVPNGPERQPSSTPSHPDSDERGSSTRDEEESEAEEEEEEEDAEARGVLDMTDIQVVQIGDEGGDEEECEEGEEEGERDDGDGGAEKEEEEGVERVVVGEGEEEGEAEEESMEVEVKEEEKEELEEEEVEDEEEEVADRTQEDVQVNSEKETGSVGEEEAMDQGEGLTSEQAAEERGSVGEEEAMDQGKGLTSEQAAEESGERAEEGEGELIEEKKGETNGSTVVEPEPDGDSEQRV